MDNRFQETSKYNNLSKVFLFEIQNIFVPLQDIEALWKPCINRTISLNNLHHALKCIEASGPPSNLDTDGIPFVAMFCTSLMALNPYNQ